MFTLSSLATQIGVAVVAFVISATCIVAAAGPVPMIG